MRLNYRKNFKEDGSKKVMIKKCQVFTPVQNVNELLNAVGYTCNLYGKRVIENACGDGSILKEIVKRYIEDSMNNKRNKDEIIRGLENDIYGFEIDDEHYNNCLRNLDDIASNYKLNNVKWNVSNTDFLKQKINNKFDYVIGNPPYITYRDLDDETRVYLKENFLSCRYGKYDYCYAFIEASLTCLKDSGKLAYLIPNSIFKNVFAQELRNIILPSTLRILDYTTTKIFKDVLTSSAILVCDKNTKSKNIEYYDITNNKTYIIDKAKLEGKWVFVNNVVAKTKMKKFGDYFSASICIATLFNKAYILADYSKTEDYILVNNFKIENSIVRKGVSPRSLNYGKDELILFPYRYKNCALIRYKCDEFEMKFPEATKYLKSYDEDLKKRKADKNVEWFEYGRTQALAHLDQPKLLLSTVVTKEVKVYELTRECIPYSGIYIVPKKDLSLEKAKEILEGYHFYQYVKGIGINASGSSIRITARDINDYEF